MLREALNKLVGMPGKPLPTVKSDCPHEAELLAYIEGGRPAQRREALESHFANCDDCCERLALFTQVAGDQVKGFDPALLPPPEELVEQQTAKVLSLINEDERRSRQHSGRDMKQGRERRPGYGFLTPSPQLSAAAVVICAVAVLGIVQLTGNQPSADDAMEALQVAMKDGRNIEPRISGGFERSPYRATRGQIDKNDLQYDRAVNKVRAAEKESDASQARHVFARALLARAGTGDLARALAVLESLAAKGASPEVLNDLGVAYFQLGRFDEAISSFNKALERQPGFDEALFNKALAHDGAGNRSQAKQDYKQYINQSSSSSWKAEAEEKLKALERF